MRSNNRSRLPRFIIHMFGRLPFMKPLSIMLFAIFVIYLLFNGFYLLSTINVNYQAAQIRDKEEVRMAEAWTKIISWKRQNRLFPFHYSLPDEGHLSYPKLQNLPGLVLAILVPNRREHQIDAYEPAYAIESMAHILSAIEHDLTRYGRRFSFINITICPTADNLTNFNELKIIAPMLIEQSVKRRPVPLDKLSLTCRTVMDFGNCVSQSLEGVPDPAYVVLLEDDMMMELQAINQIWRVLFHFETRQHSNPDATIRSPLTGLVQLHTPGQNLHYTIFDLSSLVELCALSALLTLILFVGYLRHWYRSFVCAYNIIFIVCTFIVCAFFVSLIGRTWWLLTWYRVLHHQSVHLANYPNAASTGASSLFPSVLAKNLAAFLRTFTCDELTRRHAASKSDLIAHFLSTHNLNIWTTLPNLVKHRGLYSLYTRDGIAPDRVE